MKKYPKMKPSGVEWIGDVPEHWEVEKLKFWVSLINEKEEDATIFDFKISLDIIEKFTGKLISGEATFEGLGSKFQAGDVLFNKLRPYLAKAVLAEKDGIAVSELLVLRPQNLSGKFLLYRVLASDFLSIVDGSTNGAKMPRANWDFIGNLKLAKPPLPEQTAIAAYLDRKTAQIDQSIAEKERLIELFREERQAIINHAVTKGIRPGAKMKPSGVEWIGDVPEGWKITMLKYLFTYEKGKNAATYTQEFIADHLGEFPVYSGQTENEGVLGRISTFDYNFETVLFVTTVGAKAMTLRQLHGKFSLSQNCALIVARDQNVSGRFFYYYLQCHFDYEKGRISLIMQPSLRFEDLNSYRVICPPFEEQKEIANYLDQKTAQIDTAISGIRQEIALLQEYRQALIFEAVTGKIDVRENA
jgi:type I restriction enzyme S subunit